jgi:hypothetical protein
MSASNASGIPGSPMPQGTSPWNNAVYASRNFFVYESDFPAGVSLAPGQSVNETFNIAGDSDFFWTKFAVSSLASDGDASGIAAVPALNILITNTTTGRQYSTSAVPLANIAGTGKLPFILPQITMWQRKSTIQVALQNLSSDTTYAAVFLSFLGIKAFPQPGQ